MVAMQKAQIGFQATLQVRNRLVQAYSEIMNMQVAGVPAGCSRSIRWEASRRSASACRRMRRESAC